MKMNNKIIALFSVFIIFGIYFVNQNDNFKSLKEERPIVFTKVKKQDPRSLIEEIKKEVVQKEKYVNNRPSDYLKRFKTRNNRVLIGSNIDAYTNLDTPLVFKNSINKEWKNLLGANLLKFQLEGTKVEIKDEFPATKVIEGKGLYCQQVVVTFTMKNGDESSFRALVNTESGQIEDTWDRNISENKSPRTPASLTLTPMENVKGY